MGELPMRRVGAVGAVGFIVLNIVAYAIVGTAPSYGAAPAKIAAYFTSHHKGLLVSVVLLGVGFALLIATLAQVSDMLRSVGLPDAATAFAIAGGVLVAILGVATAILGSMSQMAKSGTDPGTLRAFYQAAQFIVSIPSAWVGLFLVAPLARAALMGAVPRWVAPLNGLLALLLVLGGIAVRGSGVLAVRTGAFASLANIAFILLFLEIALLLWRSAPAGAKFLRPATTPV